MSRTVYFRGATGDTYYAKALPLTTPWATGAVVGSETGTTGSFSFAALDDATAYEVFQQAGGSPADSDAAVAAIDVGQVDLVDAPNATAVAAMQSGLATATVLATVGTNVAAIPDLFPSNFNALLINASGHVSRVTLVDTTTDLTNGGGGGPGGGGVDAATKADLDAAQASIESACATVTTTQIRSALSGRWTNVGTGPDHDDVAVGDTP